MRIFDYPTEGEASDDDPPSGPPSLTCDERNELIAKIMRLLWRIVFITTERGAKPLQKTIGLYCRDVKYVYYAVHPNSHNRDSIRLESTRHEVDGPLHPRTLQPLTNEQLQELLVIVTYELKQLTELPRKE